MQVILFQEPLTDSFRLRLQTRGTKAGGLRLLQLFRRRPGRCLDFFSEGKIFRKQSLPSGAPPLQKRGGVRKSGFRSFTLLQARFRLPVFRCDNSLGLCRALRALVYGESGAK
jgi:hypothetical protein